MPLKIELTGFCVYGAMAPSLVKVVQFLVGWQGETRCLLHDVNFEDNYPRGSKNAAVTYSDVGRRLNGSGKYVIMLPSVAMCEWKTADTDLSLAVLLRASQESGWAKRGKIRDLRITKAVSIDRVLAVALQENALDRVYAVHVQGDEIELDFRLRMEWQPTAGVLVTHERTLGFSAAEDRSASEDSRPDPPDVGSSGPQFADDADADADAAAAALTAGAQRLGRGGYAVVRAGQWLGFDVAIKSFQAVELHIQRTFVTEVSALCAVRHPLVVQPLAVAFGSSLLHLVMERVMGCDLGQMRSGLGAQVGQNLTWLQLLLVLQDVARALAAVHAAGYVHCDVKPGNVLVVEKAIESARTEAPTRPTIFAKLCDFGTACRSVKAVAAGTDSGGCIGSLDYCAPELLELTEPLQQQQPLVSQGPRTDGRRSSHDGAGDSTSFDGATKSDDDCADNDDSAADIYSLGMTLFNVVTGRRPLAELEKERFMHMKAKRVRNGFRPSLEQSFWPERVRLLLNQMWQPLPSARPSALEVLASLDKLAKACRQWPQLPDLEADQRFYSKEFEQVAPADWTTANVIQWINSLDLDKSVFAKLRSNGICGPDLLVADPSWLKNRGLGPLGARKRVQLAAAKLDGYDRDKDLVFMRCQYGQNEPFTVIISQDTTFEELNSVLTESLGVSVRAYVDGNETERISSQKMLDSFWARHRGSAAFVRLVKGFGGSSRRSDDQGTIRTGSSASQSANISIQSISIDLSSSSRSTPRRSSDEPMDRPGHMLGLTAKSVDLDPAILGDSDTEDASAAAIRERDSNRVTATPSATATHTATATASAGSPGKIVRKPKTSSRRKR